MPVIVLKFIRQKLKACLATLARALHTIGTNEPAPSPGLAS